MWLVIINCSAEAWSLHSKEFDAIAPKHPGTLVSSKQRTKDESRLIQYKFEDVEDAEAFQDECAALSGFSARFESL
jgi:hypothetical protein